MIMCLSHLMGVGVGVFVGVVVGVAVITGVGVQLGMGCPSSWKEPSALTEIMTTRVMAIIKLAAPKALMVFIK